MELLRQQAPPTEDNQIFHTENGIECFIGESSVGQGVLYITDSCVRWLGPENQGFSIEYPSISIHAISRDTTAFPRPCLYLLTEGAFSPDGDAANGSDDGAADIVHLRLCPSDETALETIFHSMSDGQSLHPDNQQDNVDLEAHPAMLEFGMPEVGGIPEQGNPEFGQGDAIPVAPDEFFYDMAGAMHLNQQGQQVLQNLEAMFQDANIQDDDGEEQMDHTNGDLYEEDDMHVRENTEMYIGQRFIGKGTIHVNTSHVKWVGPQDIVVSLEYRDISLHAVSRDFAVFPKPCVYVMTEKDVSEFVPKSHPENGHDKMEEEGEESDDEDDNDDDGITEIRFCPASVEGLQAIYDFIAEGQLLNPDPEDDDSDDPGFEPEQEQVLPKPDEIDADQYGYEDLPQDESQPFNSANYYSSFAGASYFTGEEGLQHLTAEGQRTYEHLLSVIKPPESEAAQPAENSSAADEDGDQMDEGQFDDADMGN